MVQTKGTHGWLLYPFDFPQICRVYSCPSAGPVLFSALPCCSSLSWQQHLLALAYFQETCHTQGEKETQQRVLEKAWGCEKGALNSPWKHGGFPQLLFCCLLVWGPEGDEHNDGYMKKEHKLGSLNCSLCNLAWHIIINCWFCALFWGSDSVSKKRLIGEGTRNTTQRSLMFPGKLAHKYIMNFILFMRTSYCSGKERWLVHFLQCFSVWMTDIQMTRQGSVVHFCSNCCNFLTIVSLIKDRYVIYYYNGSVNYWSPTLQSGLECRTSGYSYFIKGFSNFE